MSEVRVGQGVAAGPTRDRVTALCYGALASYAFWLYGLGPVLALLRRDLGFSYIQVSLHTTVWALGTVLTGLGYTPLVRRFGRPRVFWWSAAGVTTGAVLLAARRSAAVTLPAVAVMGTAGTLLQTGTAGALADRHGPLRYRVFVEANVGASVAAVLAPVIFAGLAASQLGWRLGLLLPGVALGLLFVVRRGADLTSQTTPTATLGRLPVTYWLAAVLVAVVVAIEFCLVFFGALLLQEASGFTPDEAAVGLSAFVAGELAGRVVGSRLVGSPQHAARLLSGALAATSGSFLVFWISTSPWLSGFALFLVGLSVANLYPLAFAGAVSAASDRADAAAGRVQLLIGAAVVAAPLALGGLADAVGVRAAFAIEPVLLVAAALLLRAGSRARRQQA